MQISNMKPIDTAPLETSILATDGKWWAVIWLTEDRTARIHHFACCQEYDWKPTLWTELPDD